MTVTVEWDAAHIAIIIAVHDEWSWAEYHTRGAEIVALLDDVSPPATIIHNMRSSTYMPVAGFADNFRHAANTYHAHPQTRTIVTIAPSSNIQYLFEQTWGQYGAPQRNYLYAKSVKDAYALISNGRS